MQDMYDYQDLSVAGPCQWQSVQTSVASPNKKQAKVEAATISLQALGILPS